MKISFHSVLLGLASCIGIQQSVIASPPSSSHQSISTESAEALKQQFSIALAKQEKQQISILQKKLTALFSHLLILHNQTTTEISNREQNHT